jgi:hypothetical protein
MVAFSLRRNTRRARWKVFFILWSFGIAVVAFYCGVLLGIHAAISKTSSDGVMSLQSILGLCEQSQVNPGGGGGATTTPIKNKSGRTPQEQQAFEQEIQWRVNLALKHERTAKKSRKDPRFPSSMAEAFVGAALVDKTMFLDRFDTGIARASKTQPKNEHVYIIYQKKQAIPNAMHDEVSHDGPLPILSVEDATENCESLNVISTRPFSGVKQCIAIVNQYESYHVLRWLRNVANQPINSTLYDLRRVGRGIDVNSGGDEMQPPPSRSQDKNWKRLTRYFTSLADIRPRLKAVLEELTGIPFTYVARDDVIRPAVIVMVCNLGQADLLINFVCTARAKGLDLSKILVFCTDTDTLEIAQGLGLFAFYDEINFKAIPSEEAGTYGDDVFADVMFIKAITVQLVSQLGYDVLFQDVDVVWNANPLEFFRTKYQEFDILFQDDGARSVRFAPYAGNTGFYYVRHNARTKYMLTNLVYVGDQLQRAASHQQVMGIVLSEHAMHFGLRVKTMSNDPNFAGGYEYHRDPIVMKKIVTGEITPMIFHMCWTYNRDNKLNFMEQMGMWQVDEACKTGSKAYAMLKTGEEFFLDNCCAREPIVTCHFSDKPSIIPCKDSPKIDMTSKPFW